MEPLSSQIYRFHLSQTNPVIFNPAFSGSLSGKILNTRLWRSDLGYQSRNKGIDNCVHFSSDRAIRSKDLNLNFQVLNRKAYGELLKINEYSIGGSKYLAIDKHNIVSFGLQTGIRIHRISPMNLKGFYQNDFDRSLDITKFIDTGNKNLENYSRTYGFISAGAAWMNQHFELGYAIHQLNRPFAFKGRIERRLNTRHTINFNLDLDEYKNIDVHLISMVSFNGNEREIQGGLALKKQRLSLSSVYEHYSFSGNKTISWSNMIALHLLNFRFSYNADITLKGRGFLRHNLGIRFGLPVRRIKMGKIFEYPKVYKSF
ncbi:MAG TPA: type IX secretion system membrane protein PorP/SprF [Bacteroidia bacterium]